MASNAGYFYSDGIVKYDRFSTSQIDNRFAVRDSTITRLLSITLYHSHYLTLLLLFYSLSLSHPLPSPFLYPKMMLYLRVVG
jgi:hypothetical protein